MTPDPKDLSASPSPESARRLVGGEGVWTFILADIVLFGLLFATFAYYWNGQRDVFEGAQAHLDQGIGAVNTVVLLTSSLFVARAVRALRAGNSRSGRILIGLAMACGAGFIILKAHEYAVKIRDGFGLGTNDFFMFYYVMTGLHLVHVTLGMVVLAFLWTQAKAMTQGRFSVGGMEAGAAYWHMVDLLWIFLFPLFYFAR